MTRVCTSKSPVEIHLGGEVVQVCVLHAVESSALGESSPERDEDSPPWLVPEAG